MALYKALVSNFYKIMLSRHTYSTQTPLTVLTEEGVVACNLG